MLRPLLAALLLASLLVPAPAHAQVPTAGPTLLLEDPAGDVALNAGGSPAGAVPGAVYSGADLVALTLSETRSDVTFTLTFDDLKAPDEETAPDGMRTIVLFTHNLREFQLEIGRGVTHLSTEYFSYLSYRDDPTAVWSDIWVGFGEARPDYAADTLALSLSRDLLADADGAAPFPGRSLGEMRVSSGSQFRESPIFNPNNGVLPAVGFPVWVKDEMPEADAPAATYAIQVGVTQTGHARLSSDIPFRASNGEATTYILEAKASNLADREDTFTFGIAGASDRLTVVVPIQVLVLEAGASRDVPVLVTVPFGHQHGDAESFVLEMRSDSDPGSVGRVEMGIRFLAVPQPAGHHDTVYLHAMPPRQQIGPLLPFREGFMSTLEEDPAAAPGNHHSSGSGGIPGQWMYWFYYRLQPTLEMGLDFDLERDGRLVVPIGSATPMMGTKLFATLYLWSPEAQSQVTIAMLESESADVQAGAPHRFELAFTASDDADRIPFAPGMEMYLDLRVETTTSLPMFGAAEGGAYVAPGGSIQLPLNEWHDDVDEVLSALAGPGLSPLGDQERMVNPGEAAIFHVSIANPLDTDVDVALEVTGPNQDWATLPASKVRVPAHDTARASVVVRAPANTVPGERADLVLQAYSPDDPAARGLLRFVTLVDTSADHPDDTAAAAELETKDSPAGGLAVPAAALLVALVAGLRRRQS